MNNYHILFDINHNWIANCFDSLVVFTIPILIGLLLKMASKFWGNIIIFVCVLGLIYTAIEFTFICNKYRQDRTQKINGIVEDYKYIKGQSFTLAGIKFTNSKFSNDIGYKGNPDDIKNGDSLQINYVQVRGYNVILKIAKKDSQ